jgi:uncharacterized protein YybS (DUF2232 family)
MKVPGKGELLDFSKGCLLTQVLFLAYISLPLAGFIPGLFTPLPAMFYTLKNGKWLGISIVGASTILLLFITTPVITLLYLIQGGVISIALPMFLSKGWGGTRAIVSSVAVSFIALLIFVAVSWQYGGFDLNETVLKGIRSSSAQTVSIYEKSGLKGEELLTLQQGMKQAGDIIARIYPALTLVALGVIAGLNLQMLRRLAQKIGQTLNIASLKTFRNPDHLIWFVIIPGFALLVENRDVVTVASNLLVVTLSLYFIQGLGVVVSIFERFTVPGFIRITFYILLGLQPYLLAGLALLGVFDLWGNFRIPRHNKNL